MSYRKWMKKWQVVIFWAIAIAFLAGVIWWSVGLYVSSRREDQSSTIDATVAYLTKDGTAVNTPTYWIFPSELQDRFTQYENMVRMYYGQDLDPIFDEPLYKAHILKQLMVEKVLLYYADQSGIKVLKKEVDEKLNEYRKQIEGNENYLNYVKRNFGSVDRYLTMIRKDVETSMIINKVRSVVSEVAEDELRNYYNSHKDEIKNKYSTVESKIATFGTDEEATANKFLELARKEGFTKAATDMSISVFDFTIKSGTVPDDILEAVFDATPNSIVGPFKYETINNLLVIEVLSKNIISSYGDFKSSDAYNEIKNNLTDEKFQKWYEDYVKKENLSFNINDEELKYWYSYIENYKDKKALIELYNDLDKKVFIEGQFNTDLSDLLKALYVVLLETQEMDLQDYKYYISLGDKISEDEKEKFEEIKKFYGELKKEGIENKIKELRDKEKEVVKFLYDAYRTSLGVVQRAAKLFPDDPQVLYDYYHLQYESMKSMLPYAQYDQRMMSSLMQVVVGLYGVYMSDKASTDLKFDAIYDVYELYKTMGDATSASSVLSEMKEKFPDRLEYDVEFQQLEDMIEESTTEESSPATE
ncbi:MAG: peptidyl-prolyl cis-trans isomerase [Thermotogaceae bacterium]|nr:peptidyl-prolyl cis-trans isomerase [Thermotogaceae bacterium]